ncbi:MAG: 6-phosphofructokinase [Candidatus Aminicenantes bacterium]|nr:6-phosphofructokinase [Candidatus Aminicenantes bacterium]
MTAESESDIIAVMLDFKAHKKVAILFSGGPAPSANAVISSVALNFINARIPIIGFFFGFEFLEDYDSKNRYSLSPNVHYQVLDATISRIRNQRGVFLKTSRANPGRLIKSPQDLDDAEKNKRLRNILEALDSLGIGCLITIGGDDTLKTANFLSRLGLPVIHIPKTIDNDYFGIAWTFGYWSSVQASQEALLNLKADAESTGSYFIAELMGRKAGWLTYAAGIAGEAIQMVSTEDVEEDILDLEKLAEKIVDTILLREKNDKYYGVICVAEGLADKLPEKSRPTEKDRHGNVILGAAEVGRVLRDVAEAIYQRRTGRKKKIIYKQIGYETRNALPISFDVVLASMLGFGAFKLFKNRQFDCMVSVSDNFSIVGVPFEQLIDPQTLLTKLRNVPRGSDFFNLKEALSYKTID